MLHIIFFWCWRIYWLHFTQSCQCHAFPCTQTVKLHPGIGSWLPGLRECSAGCYCCSFSYTPLRFRKASAFRRESTFLSVVPVFPLWGFVWEGLCGRNGKERLCRRILKTSAFWVFCLLPLYVSQILQETELLRASCFPVWSRAQSIRNCLPYPGSIPWSMKKTRRESKKISFGTGKMLDYIGKVCYNYKWAYFSVCTKQGTICP